MEFQKDGLILFWKEGISILVTRSKLFRVDKISIQLIVESFFRKSFCVEQVCNQFRA